MQRLKEWQTLDKSLKISRKDMWSSTVFVCTILCNLQPPLVANIGDSMSSPPSPADVDNTVYISDYGSDNYDMDVSDDGAFMYNFYY